VKRAALLLDVACVLAFVVIGRANHAEAASVTGLARTAWPFLAGLAIGLAGTRAWRRPAAIIPAGLGAWLGTVGFGMILRAISGQGTAAAFVLVALVFLGPFMLGWRTAAIAKGSVRTGRLPQR
jgi:hypothetical protein